METPRYPSARRESERDLFRRGGGALEVSNPLLNVLELGSPTIPFRPFRKSIPVGQNLAGLAFCLSMLTIFVGGIPWLRTGVSA